MMYEVSYTVEIDTDSFTAAAEAVSTMLDRGEGYPRFFRVHNHVKAVDIRVTAEGAAPVHGYHPEVIARGQDDPLMRPVKRQR